jgi:membrane protease YdiL (CAAX protease family)
MLRRLASPEPEPPWSFLTGLGALIAMFATIVLGTTLAQTLLGADETPTTLITGWSIGALLTILYVVISRRRDREANNLRIRRRPRALPLLLMFSVGVAILFDLLGWLFSGEQTLAASELISFNRTDVSAVGWLLALLYMGMLQPAAEELVLRGLLLPSLRSAAGPWIGLVLGAGFHAAFHFLAFQPPGDNASIALWFGFGLPLLDGLYFSMVRTSANSTRAAMLAHAMFGLFRVLKVFTFAG